MIGTTLATGPRTPAVGHPTVCRKRFMGRCGVAGRWGSLAGALAVSLTQLLGSESTALADCTVADYGWTMTFGNQDSGTTPRGVAVDPAGGVVLVGLFGGTVDFDPSLGTDEHSSRGHSDVFVSKLHSDGTYVWTRTFGGEREEQPRDIAVAADGSIYITGYFTLAVDFDPTEGVDVHSTGSSDLNVHAVFLTKLNGDGSYGWTSTIPPLAFATALAADAENGVVLLTHGYGMHLDRYSPGGVHIWSASVTSAPSTSTWANGKDVAVGDDGAVFVVGSFRGPLDFDPTAGTDERVSLGEIDAFILRLTSEGDYAGTITIGAPSGRCGPTSVTVSDDASVYVTGSFEDTVDFDPSENEDLHVSCGSSDVFVTKLFASGDYAWTRTIGGSSEETSYHLALDSAGDPTVAGEFGARNHNPPEYTIDFDPTSGTDLRTSTGVKDMFVTRLCEYGWYGWTETFGGLSESERIAGIAVDSDNSIYLVGSYHDAVDFDPTDGEDIREPLGNSGTFLLKLQSVPVMPFILASDPEDGTIDARQDLSTTGITPQGIDRVRLTFSCRVQDAFDQGPLSDASFELQDTAGTPPEVLDVVPTPDRQNTHDVFFTDPIAPGAWTTLVAHVQARGGQSIRPDPDDRIDIGFLPGDANGDGMSAPSDILALIDALNGVRSIPLERTDIDRSSVARPADILRLIDLLNGANTSRSWLNAQLPPRP